MKHFLLGLFVLLAVATLAFANAGDALKPLYVRWWQGTTRVFKEVSCTTGGDVALVTAAEARDALSVLFQNIDGTNYVTLCSVAAAAGTCNNANKGLTVYPKSNLPIDRSVRDGAWSCKGDTGNVTVEVLIEK